MARISSGSSISLRTPCRCNQVDLAGDPAGARVAGGLAHGARIVTAGIHSLKQGQQVRTEQDQKP